MIIESTGEAPETAKAVAQISRTQCADPAHWKLAKTRDLPSTLPAVLRFLSSRRKRRPSVAHYRSSARMRGCATGATSSEQLKISDETLIPPHNTPDHFCRGRSVCFFPKFKTLANPS